MTDAVVMEPHAASYATAIAVAAGDPLRLSGETDDWEGHVWLWAEGPDGRLGWVPDDLPARAPDGALRAARAFDAMELTVAPGETVGVLERAHGWARLRNAMGACGWVPERVLSTG